MGYRRLSAFRTRSSVVTPGPTGLPIVPPLADSFLPIFVSTHALYFVVLAILLIINHYVLIILNSRLHQLPFSDTFSAFFFCVLTSLYSQYQFPDHLCITYRTFFVTIYPCPAEVNPSAVIGSGYCRHAPELKISVK